MQIDQEIWWRDAWWRLRQLVSIECKVERNKDMPLTDLVGHVGRYLQSRTAENFKIDDGDDLYSGYIEPGVKRYLPFQTIEKNGIKWSYCKLSTDRAVINIAQSEAVGDLPYGVAVIPDVIDGCLVESVRSIGCCVPKPWRKVVFANEIDGNTVNLYDGELILTHHTYTQKESPILAGQTGVANFTDNSAFNIYGGNL